MIGIFTKMANNHNTLSSDEEDFYLHLNSEKLNGFDENDPGAFRCVLPRAIQLDKKYEVALESIVVPNAFYNISEKEATIYYSIHERISIVTNVNDSSSRRTTETGEQQQEIVGGGEEEVTDVNEPVVPPPPVYRYEKGQLRTFKLTVETGFYDAISYAELVNERFEVKKQTWSLLYPSLPVDQMRFRLYFNRMSKKMDVVLNETWGEKIELRSREIREIWGCQLTTPFVIDKSRQILPFSCNFNRKFQTMFVYADFVTQSVVGNIYAPVLRIFDINEELNTYFPTIVTLQNDLKVSKQTIAPTFDRLQFYGISKDTLQVLTFKISNEKGENFVFQNTRDLTNLTLHFRRKKTG